MSYHGPRVSRLSVREQQVFDMLGAGKTNKAIARELFRSEKTISTYAVRIREKMGFGSMRELLRAAFLASVKS